MLWILSFRKSMLNVVVYAQASQTREIQSYLNNNWFSFQGFPREERRLQNHWE